MTAAQQRVFHLVLGVLVGLAVLAAILPYRASRRQQAADRAWAESFESMDALMARYPAAPNSAAAVTLTSLAKGLGLSLLPPDRSAEGASGAPWEEVAPAAAERFRARGGRPRASRSARSRRRAT